MAVLVNWADLATVQGIYGARIGVAAYGVAYATCSFTWTQAAS